MYIYMEYHYLYVYIWNIPYMWDELGVFWMKFTDPISAADQWGEFRESWEPLLKGWESLQPSSLHSKFDKRIWYLGVQ